MSDETTRKPSKAAAAAPAKAHVRETSPRGTPAKARVPEKAPASAAAAAKVQPTTIQPTKSEPAKARPAKPEPVASAPVLPAAPAAKPARRASAPKTTALKSAALKAAAAPRPDPETVEAAEAEAPAAAPTSALTSAPTSAPAPVTAPADPAPARAVATAPAEIPPPSLAPRAAAPEQAVEARTVEHEEAFSEVGIAPLPDPDALVKPYGRMLQTGAEGARAAYAQTRESNEALTQACFESAAAASRGMVSLNAQMLDMMRANADLTLGLMRSTLTAGSLSEAVKLQTSGARQAYETTSAHLRAIADTTTKLVGDATGPITQAMTKR
ncbi:MAG: phasin family protein [Salinarimonas sp.]